MYKQIYISLQEGVRVIADRMAVADQRKYANADAAVDEAREQLLEALFEGAVRAEGVTEYPSAPPAYEPPSIEYEEWSPINRVTWSHERCEKREDSYRLDIILVRWNDNLIDYYNSDDEWAERHDNKIRLHREDIDNSFPASEKAVSANLDGAAREQLTYRTGVAGRPSSKHLASKQMQRRASEGKLCDKLAEEVRELCEWLGKSHPEAPPATPKALENALRTNIAD